MQPFKPTLPRIVIASAMSLCALAWYAAAADPKPAAPSRPALARARREVRMLDDLYKTSVVFVNDTYVDDESDVAAGTVFRTIFEAMQKKGWHEARLVDATGEPVNSDNTPRDGFEKTAVKKLLGGETYYEQVERDGNREYLRAVTLVPAVNQKCLICHPGHKVGDVLGGISYKISLDSHH